MNTYLPPFGEMDDAAICLSLRTTYSPSVESYLKLHTIINEYIHRCLLKCKVLVESRKYNDGKYSVVFGKSSFHDTYTIELYSNYIQDYIGLQRSSDQRIANFCIHAKDNDIKSTNTFTMNTIDELLLHSANFDILNDIPPEYNDVYLKGNVEYMQLAFPLEGTTPIYMDISSSRTAKYIHLTPKELVHCGDDERFNIELQYKVRHIISMIAANSLFHKYPVMKSYGFNSSILIEEISPYMKDCIP